MLLTIYGTECLFCADVSLRNCSVLTHSLTVWRGQYLAVLIVIIENKENP